MQRHLRPGAEPEVGRHRAAHRDDRPALLHHRLPDLGLADAVRVQPRRRRARCAVLGEAEQGQDPGQRGDRRRRSSACILTLPALVKVNIGTADEPIYTVTAFFAVVSIGVIGLYLAFAIPIYYRWQAGRRVQAGLVEPRQQVEVDGAAGGRSRSSSPRSTSSCRSTRRAPRFMRGLLGAPSAEEVPFDWKFVNYAPIVLGGVLIAAVDRLAPVGQEVVHRAEDAPIDLPRGRLVGRRDRAGARAQGLPPAARHLIEQSTEGRAARWRVRPLLLEPRPLTGRPSARRVC